MTTAGIARVEPEILKRIREEDQALTDHFSERLLVNRDLTRTLVSFQANKEVPVYRWFKFKEGFSSPLVDYVLDRLHVTSGRILDPFAGSGAALFAASARGLDGVGIELLPIGCEVMKARRDAFLHREAVLTVLNEWIDQRPWHALSGRHETFPHLGITRGAFPLATERQLERYLGAIKTVTNHPAQALLRLAALSILEEISYTRKDGQYLRWDDRSRRRCRGSRPFHKRIKKCDDAMMAKLLQMKEDLIGCQEDLFSRLVSVQPGTVEVMCGSCLDRLPKLPSRSFDVLITSPPYCNRYDYTRTYALELAMLGITDESLKQLRQAMLSCTVENREKEGLQGCFSSQRLTEARRVFAEQALLEHILEYLETLRGAGLLNNSGIPRMVRNYFWEMTLVILECARVLKPGAPMVMVNDNVRYAGVSIPVDLILSRIAEGAGLRIKAIWVLPRGKGNSSQQMGAHGRAELRKCVYVWSKAR